MISADKNKVEYVIDAESYEQIINNVRYMAPLEIGIEVAVYMLLYGILDHKKYCVLDINTMTKRNAVVYVNEQGKDERLSEVNKTADLVIVGADFKYSDTNKSGAYRLVEVKYLSKNNSDEEYALQRDYTNHFIWTNGLQWRYSNYKNEIKEFNLIEANHLSSTYKIRQEEFNKLITFLGTINRES